MVGALWTGISGLSSHQSAIDNESHNISNVNTVGYKASRISFADQMYQDKIGKGTKILDAEKLFTQGSLNPTGVAYDMALSGDGFFCVSNTRSSGTSETFYTRSGNFRMGDNGTLQDAAGNEVQGWAMLPIDTDEDVVSTNSNVSMFTTDYTQLLGNKTIKYSSSVATLTAKSTDYNSTAKADSETVFTGNGQKTVQSKVSDIEALIANYNTQVQRLSEDPNGSSTSSLAQVTYIDFDDKVSNGPLTKEGDIVYVYLNGNKIAQDFDTSYENTMKLLADKISNTQGFNAYIANDGIEETDSTGDVSATTTNDKVNAWATSTDDKIAAKGVLKIESMIPGETFSISEVGFESGSTTTLGTVLATSTVGNDAVQGTGMGAVQSSMDALGMAIAGKQRDVYTTDDLNLNSTNGSNFTYTATLYDKELKANVTIPDTGKVYTLTNMKSVDDIVTELNSDSTFSKYLIAEKINGQLVISNLDSNYDVEFSGALNNEPHQYSYTEAATGANATGKAATYDTSVFSVDDDATYTFQVTIDGTIYPGTALTITNPADVDAVVAAINADATLAAKVTATNVGGNLEIELNSATESFDSVDLNMTADRSVTTSSAATANALASYTYNNVTPNGIDDFTFQFNIGGTANSNVVGLDGVTGGTNYPAATTITVENPNDVKTIVGALNDNAEFAAEFIASIDSTTGGLKVEAKNLTNLTANTTFHTTLDISYDTTSLIERNADYSGREGAGAEFLQMTTRIDQTASKDSLQLRLDTLGISDSAFGEFSVDDTGLITMQQDGADFVIGQVAIAVFNNNRGLEPSGDNLFAATSESGSAIFNINNDKTAKIEGGNLELSTADLSKSLVNLMVFQRAFEANAKSITTSDELLNTLINLKR